MRFTSVQTDQGSRLLSPKKMKEKILPKIETSASPLTRENLIDHENHQMLNQSTSQFEVIESFDDSFSNDSFGK